MNKKFSTLVAALLVSGASYAVVSQYGTPVLTSSPIATAAAANLKAVSAEDVFSKATAEIEVQKWTYSHTAWTVETVENGFKLKNGNFYVGINASGVYGTKEAKDAAIFTYEDYTLKLGDKAFTIGEQTFSLFTVPAIGSEEKSNLLMDVDLSGVTEVYVAAYQEPAKFANGETSYVSGSAMVAPTVGYATSDFASFTLSPEGYLSYEDEATGLTFYVKLNADKNGIEFTADKSVANKIEINSTYQTVWFANENLAIIMGTDEVTAGSSGSGVYIYNGDNKLTTLPEEDVTVTVKSDSNGLSVNSGTAATASTATDEISDNTKAQWILEESDEDAQYYLRLASDEATGYLRTNGEDEDATLLPNGTKEQALTFTLDEKGNLKQGESFVTIGEEGLKLAATAEESQKVAFYSFAQAGAEVTIEDVELPLTGTAYILGANVPAGEMDADAVAMYRGSVTEANLVDDDNYYITINGQKLCWNKDADEPTTFSGNEESQFVKTALWTVEKTQPAGQEPSYKFKNVATGKYLAVDEEGNWDVNGKYNSFNLSEEHMHILIGNDEDRYLSFSNGKWSMSDMASEETTNVTFEEAENTVVDVNEGIADQIHYLNSVAGNGAGFGLIFRELDKDGKLQNLDVEANPWTDASMIVAVEGPKEYDNLYTIGGKSTGKTANLSGKMFFRVSGSYSNEMKEGNAAEQKAKISAFRNSEFIVVDTIRYSDLITDATTTNEYFIKYKTVKGSELMSAVGHVFDADYTYDKGDFEVYNATKNPDGAKLLGVTRRIENAEFTCNHYEGDDYTDPVQIYTNAIIPADDNNIGLEGHAQSAVNDGTADQEKLYVALKKYDGKYYVGAAAKPYEFVFLGLNNDVDYKTVNGIVNIISRNYKTNGQVFATTESNNGIERVLPKYVSTDKPEGQFLVRGGYYAENGALTSFQFSNRESGNTRFALTTTDSKTDYRNTLQLKKTDKANIYSVVGYNDTIEIKNVTTPNEFYGYKNYKAADLKNTEYVLKVVSKAGNVDDLYITEDHNKDHSLGLNADTLETATFKLIKFEAAKSDAKWFGDTVMVSNKPYSYVKGDNKEYAEVPGDRVVAFTYAIYNADNFEFLAVKGQGTTLENYFYCNPDLKYKGDNKDANAAAAQRFILKEKADGTCQLIPVDHINSDGDNVFELTTDYQQYVAFGGAVVDPLNMEPNATKDEALADSKLYAGVSDNKIHMESTIYKRTDNDLFRIVQVGAPMYRTLTTAPFDTIRIYKEGMDNVALYAETTTKDILSGEHFLGMAHAADRVENHSMFSFFVDTAYVNRPNNYKPQYMLALDADTLHSNYQCEIPGHPIHDSGHVDTVYGKFLVNVIDSIPTWGKNHSNPYWWEEEQYPRLGFVNAAHFNDKLVILKEEGEYTANDTIDLSNNADKLCTFAFRYVDQESGSFLMETSYDGNKTGWVKWLNGVPVVVDDIELAEVFNLEATSNNPTANETIEANGAVSVTAVDGAVVIKGAEGKNVVIATILGKVVANETINSDNETIAVPAGIAVVSVDGESFKVVVK